MDNRNKIILIAIAILLIVLIAVGAFIITSNGDNTSVNDNITIKNATNDTNKSAIMIDKDGNVENDTVVGDNSPRNGTNTSNETYRIYNPQTDSYVTVIGEAYDAEVDRWYTFDTDGVRYYNTRIKNH